MTRTGKDVAATIVTAAAVLVFAAAYSSWSVWLVGSSTRWAAGAILLLGLGACALGSPDTSGKDKATELLAVVGIVALALAIFTLISGAMGGLMLLIVADVVLWVAATARHHLHPRAHPTTSS